MVYLSNDDCNRLDSNYDHPSEALSDRDQLDESYSDDDAAAYALYLENRIYWGMDDSDRLFDCH